MHVFYTAVDVPHEVLRCIVTGAVFDPRQFSIH